MPVRRLILNVDFFGRTQSFSIAKRDSFPTYLGSFLSFTIISTLIYFVIYFGLDLINKSQLNLITSTIFVDDPLSTYINETLFTFSIQHPDYSPYIDESIYTANAYLKTMRQDNQGNTITTKKPYSLVRCSEYNFSLIPEYFSLLDLKNLYCIDNDKDLYYRGEYGKAEWTYFVIEFTKCVNSTRNNNKCKSREEIEEKLNGGYLGMFITDYSVVPDNFENPKSIYGKNVFTSISGKQYTDIWLYLKQMVINTDTGLVIKNINTLNFVSYDTVMTNTDYREGNTFLNLNLRLSQKTEIYYRSYERVQSIVAELGGIMKFCLVIGKIVSYFGREVLYKDHILRYFYEGPAKMINKDSSKDTTSATKTNNYLISQNSLIRPSMFSQTRIISKPTLVKITKEQNATKNSKITTWSLLGPCLFSSSIKKRLRDVYNTFNRVEYLFDVIHYLKINDDMKNMKRILLYEDKHHFLNDKYLFELPSLEDKNTFLTSVKITSKYK